MRELYLHATFSANFTRRARSFGDHDAFWQPAPQDLVLDLQVFT
jgi:hypothetical protein